MTAGPRSANEIGPPGPACARQAGPSPPEPLPARSGSPARRKRLAHVRDAVGKLKVKKQRYLAGEHDASLYRAAAFKEFFGETQYTFDHKGVHFIVLDNVSDPRGKLGDDQIQWLRADLGKLDKEAPIVVLTHRPLFDLAPD